MATKTSTMIPEVSTSGRLSTIGLDAPAHSLRLEGGPVKGEPRPRGAGHGGELGPAGSLEALPAPGSRHTANEPEGGNP